MLTNDRRLSARLVGWLWGTASWLAATLPLRLSYRLAWLVGRLYATLNQRQRRAAVANLAQVLAMDEAAPAARRLANRSFGAYAMLVVDLLRLARLSGRRLSQRVTVEGWEHLDRALAGGRGVVLAGAHLGSWDRAAALLAARGHRVIVLVDRVGPIALDAAVQAVRRQHGLTPVAADGRVALRQAEAALRRNGVVLLLIDRPLFGQGQAVELCGRMTRLPAGAAVLVRRTGAVLLHGYLVRRPDLVSLQGAIEPVVWSPASPPAAGEWVNRPAALERARSVAETRRAELIGAAGLTIEGRIMQALADRLTRVIGAYPEQWYMFRPMWPADR
jgi:KDO2-lipid IV(A) lauroyltransferase